MAPISRFKFLFAPSPSYIVYHVTNRCNMNCSHCFQYREGAKAVEELSADEVRRISSHLGHVTYLTLAGGEPLLRDDLQEIAEIFHTANKLHILNIVTNGWFVEKTVSVVKTILERCPKLKISVGVSIDGPEETHDRLRNAPGSYKKAIATLTALQQLSAGPGIRHRLFVIACGTYNAENAGYILPVASDLARAPGASYHVGLIRGNARDPALKKIDIAHWQQTQQRLRHMWRDLFPAEYPFRSVRLALEELLTHVITNSIRYNKMTVRCMAGQKGMLIGATGDMPLCELIDFKLGNLRDAGYDPVRILNGQKARSAIRTIVASKCHCTWECFQRMNIIFSPRMYPLLLLKSLKNI